MILQWREANDTRASHSRATGRRVEMTLYQTGLTICTKDTDRDRRQCAELGEDQTLPENSDCA